MLRGKPRFFLGFAQDSEPGTGRPAGRSVGAGPGAWPWGADPPGGLEAGSIIPLPPGQVTHPPTRPALPLRICKNALREGRGRFILRGRPLGR
jgi:hypothetical protein